MFMETGHADRIFARPRHPYTLGLLQSVPRIDAGRRQKLTPIPGSPRNMLSEPAECPFAPRCRYEVEQSRQQVPPLTELEQGQHVRCFNPVPADEWQRSRLGGAA
jgi:oligopeptide/dipeptide ABC transporter ATP-binding protein